VWGTYVHGFFESGVGRCRVLDWARGADAYERLADILVNSVDPRLRRDLGAA
jgi:hypothetical protein